MKESPSYKNILVIITGFLLVYLLFSYRLALYAATIIGIMCIVSVRALLLIDRFWMLLGHLPGQIIPRIILASIYFFILFPISVIYRFFVKDPLNLSNKHTSYFVKTERKFDRNYFEKIW